MLNKKFWFVLLALVIAFTAAQPVAAAPRLAPVLGADSPTAIADRYIVVFNPGTAAADIDRAIDSAAKGPGVAIHYRYTSALQGFAATLPGNSVEGLRRNPNVYYIEADQTMTIDASQSPATWGIDRIDQHNLPLNNTYTYNYTGAGVTAYIIDTGIRITHNEFGGRASVGYDSIGDGQNGIDCHGHGTHVSGTVGGSTYGVAKSVALVAVRVLNQRLWHHLWRDRRRGLGHCQPSKPGRGEHELGGGVSSLDRGEQLDQLWCGVRHRRR
jgi:hypothetical protein